MKVTETYEEGNFTVVKYDNGTIEKRIKGSSNASDPETISRGEIERLETALNIEYLILLIETELLGERIYDIRKNEKTS